MEEWTLLMVSKDQGIVALHVKILINANWLVGFLTLFFFHCIRGIIAMSLPLRVPCLQNCLRTRRLLIKGKAGLVQALKEEDRILRREQTYNMQCTQKHKTYNVKYSTSLFNTVPASLFLEAFVGAIYNPFLKETKQKKSKERETK